MYENPVDKTHQIDHKFIDLGCDKQLDHDQNFRESHSTLQLEKLCGLLKILKRCLSKAPNLWMQMTFNKLSPTLQIMTATQPFVNGYNKI